MSNAGRPSFRSKDSGLQFRLGAQVVPGTQEYSFGFPELRFGEVVFTARIAARCQMVVMSGGLIRSFGWSKESSPSGNGGITFTTSRGAKLTRYSLAFDWRSQCETQGKSPAGRGLRMTGTQSSSTIEVRDGTLQPRLH